MIEVLNKLGLTVNVIKDPNPPRVMIKLGATLDDDVHSYKTSVFCLDEEQDVERLSLFLTILRTKSYCGKRLSNRNVYDAFRSCEVNRPPLNNYDDYCELWVDEIIYIDEEDRRFDLSHNFDDLDLM